MKQNYVLGVCTLGVFVLAGGQAFAQTSTNPYNPLPTRIIGQPRLTPVTNVNPNFVQGQEMFAPLSVAFDRSSTPPILYVADSFNNRILAFKDPSNALSGAPADLIIGQQDQYSTIPQGPNQTSSLRLSSGFSLPTAVAVDPQGNLFVLDAGNNRILRYPQPFNQQGVLQADLVIGQTSFTSGTSANRGYTLPGKNSLSVAGFHSGMLVDPKTGDLWVSDPGNNRVLRFPASQLLAYTQDPNADAVLGQDDFVTAKLSTPPNPTTGNAPNPQLNKQGLANPAGIAMDASGRIYVADSLLRVVMYVPPFAATGNRVSRVIGVIPAQNVPVSAAKLGGTTSQGYPPPEGVFTINNNVYVIDTPNSRILRYDAPEQWAAETTDNPSPLPNQVIGQVDFSGASVNRGSKTDASNASFAHPSSAIFSGTDVWVADTDNNRVLGFPAVQGAIGTASKVFGQGEFWQRGVNRIGPDGFFFAASGSSSGGNAAVDYTSNPPRLYLADSGNNRVLGYPDARNVKAGDPATIVIGQIDFQHATVNNPSGDPLQMTDSGLNAPAGVAVDSMGNLWVADSGNGRVLRFPRPFDNANGIQRANLVLGQYSLFGQPQREQTTGVQMKNPWGIAFLYDGSAFISDPANNRVLLFRKPANGDFINAQPASGVYGQRDFSSNLPGITLDKLNGPRYISTDTDDRLYVADTGNSRVTIYRQQAAQQPSGFPATMTIDSLSAPFGVTVSPLSGTIWVANTNTTSVLRYPRFIDYSLNPAVVPDQLFSISPLSVTLDPLDNPIVTEAINRIAFYYPAITFRNAASFSNRALAPGMVADLIIPQGAFTQDTATNTAVPWPKTLADLEVVVSGTIAPITDVQPTKIRFQVPQNVPLGQADFVVRRTSTQQVVASSTLTTDIASPGFFTTNGLGTGAIVAKNPDGTDNGPSNPVARGQVVSLFGTGLGVVPNMPDDGTAPSGQLPSADAIQNLVFTNLIPQKDLANTIKYFGLAPGQVGTFQLDLVVPANALPQAANPVAFTFKDLRSSEGPNGATVLTTVYVK